MIGTNYLMNWKIIKKSKITKSNNIIHFIFSYNLFFDKLKENLSIIDPKKLILILDILDYLIDKGNITIWSSISSKKFFLPLINLLKIKDIPEVQIKLLNLIKKWGIKFENQKNILPNFNDIYTRLKANEIEFPFYNGSDYNKYFSINNDNNDNDSFYYYASLKNILKKENFEHKYRRLVDFLLNMNEKIKLVNELIDNQIVDNLGKIKIILEKGNEKLKETILCGKLKDDKLMVYTLGTAEDINSTILRIEESDKGSQQIQRFKSYFEINNTIPKNVKN